MEIQRLETITRPGLFDCDLSPDGAAVAAWIWPCQPSSDGWQPFWPCSLRVGDCLKHSRSLSL
jgi:hypothetical protein